ncbi:MAG: hypothetical protein AAF975_00980 [Spirochaetota bacterium]
MRKLCLPFLFLWAASLATLHAAEMGREKLSFKSQRGKWGFGMEGGINSSMFFPTGGLVAGFPDAWASMTLHVPDTSFLLSVGSAGIGFDGYGVNANIDFFLMAAQPAN